VLHVTDGIPVAEDQVWVQRFCGVVKRKMPLLDRTEVSKSVSQETADSGLDHLRCADKKRPGSLFASFQRAALAREHGPCEGVGVPVVRTSPVIGHGEVTRSKFVDAVHAKREPPCS